MYIYTVKLNVAESIKNEFISYLDNEHIKDVVNTGCFTGYTLEVDTTLNDIIVRYFCESQALFDDYISHHASTMRSGTLDKFSSGIIKIDRNFSKLYSSSLNRGRESE